MPIEMTCECGRDLYLRDELAGKQIQCPECGRTLTLPLGGSPPIYHEDVPFVRPAAASVPTPAYDALNERSEERRPEERRPEMPPLTVIPPQLRRAPRTSGDGINGSKVIGGVAMMIAGGAMLGVGINMCGIRFPIILLVIGFITIIRGLMGSRDDE